MDYKVLFKEIFDRKLSPYWKQKSEKMAAKVAGFYFDENSANTQNLRRFGSYAIWPSEHVFAQVPYPSTKFHSVLLLLFKKYCNCLILDFEDEKWIFLKKYWILSKMCEISSKFRPILLKTCAHSNYCHLVSINDRKIK